MYLHVYVFNFFLSVYYILVSRIYVYYFFSFLRLSFLSLFQSRSYGRVADIKPLIERPHCN